MLKSLNILGVDPGSSGALAVIRDGKLTDVHDMPIAEITVGKSKRKRISPVLMAVLLRDLFPIDVAYVEEVASMPKQGVSSVFTFGQAHGIILGAIPMMGVKMVRVRPQEWQRLVKARGDPRPRAAELYPGMADMLTRKKDEGRADAILIAHAGLIMERENS